MISYQNHFDDILFHNYITNEINDALNSNWTSGLDALLVDTISAPNVLDICGGESLSSVLNIGFNTVLK